jgi:hypothetical protein
MRYFIKSKGNSTLYLGVTSVKESTLVYLVEEKEKEKAGWILEGFNLKSLVEKK